MPRLLKKENQLQLKTLTHRHIVLIWAQYAFNTQGCSTLETLRIRPNNWKRTRLVKVINLDHSRAKMMDTNISSIVAHKKTTQTE